LDREPEVVEHQGSLQGYRAGSRVRRFVFGTLLGGSVFAAVVGVLYVQYLEKLERERAPKYAVDPATIEGRTRSIEWTEGFGRFALSREPPGVARIVLPDRVLELADGSDYAQIKVFVENGQTREVKILAGAIKQIPRGP
jgi:hypothetical protein